MIDALIWAWGFLFTCALIAWSLDYLERKGRMKSLQWNRSLGTSKRAQGVLTSPRPKTLKQRKAAARIAEKAADVPADL